MEGIFELDLTIQLQYNKPMDVTKKLLELDPTLKRHNEGAWDKDFDPKAPTYSSFNDAGIEVETGEFLYSMTRLLKPDRVLETGTHWGISASYMAMALKDNNKGELDTIEFLPEIWKVADKRFKTLKIDNIVNNLKMDVKDFKPDNNYKLILLDTEPQLRFNELIRFYPYLDEGGFVFIHDLHRHMHQIPNEEHGFAWPFGQIPLQLKIFIREERLKPLHFDTPRGLTGFYKPHSKDYEWK